MSTQKYDWENIKQNYFENDIFEVQDFLTTWQGLAQKTASNGFWKLNTKGWRTEKEDILKAQTAKAKKDLENDETIKIKNQNILRAIDNIEIKVAKLVGGSEKFEIGDIPNVKKGWEILRVSQNLPIAYNRGDQVGKDGEIIDPSKNFNLKNLSTEELLILQKINDNPNS